MQENVSLPSKIESWGIAFTISDKEYTLDALEIVSVDADLPEEKNANGEFNATAFWQQRTDWLKTKLGVDVSLSQAYAIFQFGRMRWETAKKSFVSASELVFGIVPTPGASESGKSE